MIEKIQNIILSALSKIDNFQIKGMPRIMVYLFLFIVLLCLTLFIAAWCVDWSSRGTANLAIMIQFVNAITSVSFIAAVGFFGRAMIDKDDNGTPDEFEKKEEERNYVRRP